MAPGAVVICYSSEDCVDGRTEQGKDDERVVPAPGLDYPGAYPDAQHDQDCRKTEEWP